jgi:hypothetical protein
VVCFLGTKRKNVKHVTNTLKQLDYYRSGTVLKLNKLKPYLLQGVLGTQPRMVYLTGKTAQCVTDDAAFFIEIKEEDGSEIWVEMHRIFEVGDTAA